ncbi:hypothetical protein M878_44470 [Streptomyces roseochromogenus subsp. oscitans DS 12.976]|uniref:Uncharacterized protein n=1 Tax=Streptomyces roseochromogenus subsp. oscitans DS 12.976 TaxID=1352936 RepID=V6JGC8_STRRC|nr:hypothetical protein M878_44470 [Streptomyces roseochromogenus subsp. oscitans DS 12.976]
MLTKIGTTTASQFVQCGGLAEGGEGGGGYVEGLGELDEAGG